jgi:hypothetical protein
VRAVSLANAPVTDADLLAWADHPEPLALVRVLDLSGTRVTGERLGPVLAAMSHLRELDLAGTPLTDAGLEALPVCPSLTRVDLSGTAVTDAGVRRAPLVRNGRVEVIRASPGRFR